MNVTRPPEMPANMPTNMPTDATARWQETFDTAHGNLPRAPWLDPRRETALARFHALGFPTRRDEDWRYIDVRPVAKEAWRPAPAPDAATLEAAGALLATLPPLDAAARLVFVNGHHAPALGIAGEPGVTGTVHCGSLAEALAPHSRTGSKTSTSASSAADDATLEARLGRLAAGEDHAFAALNTALWADGALIRIPRETTLEKPLHLVFLAVGEGERRMSFPRILLLGETSSSATVVETWAGNVTSAYLSNAVAEVWLEENARLDVLEIQDQTRSTWHFRALRAHLARDASFSATGITTGAAVARSDLHVRLDAEGAECRLDGLTLIDETQRVDQLTHVDHASPHGTSRQLYKSVLGDQAAVAFSGKVHVHPHAQKTNAEQANHSLLLSDDAVADAKPQLEIYADDVKCTHGATVGQMDDAAVFYMRSRGIGDRAARRMLLRAFASEIPSRVEPAPLRAHAETALARRVPEEA